MRDWPRRVAPRYQHAVFLDRDGTINVDTHFPHEADLLEIAPGAIEGIKMLSVEEKGNRWLIIDDPIDDPTVYPVRREDGELSIYHLSNSFIIGDKTSDIAAGEKVGCTGIRVKVAKKGEGGGEGKPVPIETKHFVNGLDDAALIIQSYLEQESYHKQISVKL